MRAVRITALVLIVLSISSTAFAQKVVEETFGRIKDRPDFLGFFAPDGGKPVPGILVKLDGGYFLMFHEEQSPAISRGASGHFCLSPLYYYGVIGKIAQEGALKCVPVDAGQLGANDERVAAFVTMGTTRLTKLYTAVPGMAQMAAGDNLEVEYRLLPVRKEGESYRIYDFLYSRAVPPGVYPLFGRTAKDSSIVALGYIKVGKGDRGSLIGALPE